MRGTGYDANAPRRPLKPFDFRTIAINFAAASQLTSEFGLFHRASALTNAGLVTAFHYTYQRCIDSHEFFTADLEEDPKRERPRRR